MVTLLRERGETAIGLGRGDSGGQPGLDVTDDVAVHAAMASYRPTVVVNCATWTAVDDAEAHGDEALAVNGHAPRHLARGTRSSLAVR
jgi:dTDP-4-dehydrorhamnose reductase